MKSSISTNSAFSAGFLPSPDMCNQSACSSYVGFSTNNNSKFDRQARHKSIEQMNGIVALAAASINSSLLQFKRQPPDTAENQSNSLLNVSSLKPVKITVQSDAGSVKSYEDLNRSKQTINDDSQAQSSAQLAVASDQCDIVPKRPDRLDSVTSCTSFTDRVAIGQSQTQRQTSNANSTSTVAVNNASKPGTEVLTLIATWIKNAPNDFLDTRVIDEVKAFFNQLDSLKSSFKPWTSKLKRALNLEVGPSVIQSICSIVSSFLYYFVLTRESRTFATRSRRASTMTIS